MVKSPQGVDTDGAVPQTPGVLTRLSRGPYPFLLRGLRSQNATGRSRADVPISLA